MMRLLFTLLRMRRLMRLYRMFTGGGRGNVTPYGQGARHRPQGRQAPHRTREPDSPDEPPRASQDAHNRTPDDHQP